MDKEARFFFESWLTANLQALEALEVIFRTAFISLQIPKVEIKNPPKWAREPIKPEWEKHTIRPEMPDLLHVTPKMERDYFAEAWGRGEAVLPALSFPAAGIERTFYALRDCRELSLYLKAILQHFTRHHSEGSCSDSRCFLSRPLPQEWARAVSSAIGELTREAVRIGVPKKFQEADQLVKARQFVEHRRKRKSKMMKKASAEEWRSILRRELEEREKGPDWKDLSMAKQAEKLETVFAEVHRLKVSMESLRKEIAKMKKTGIS